MAGGEDSNQAQANVEDMNQSQVSMEDMNESGPWVHCKQPGPRAFIWVPPSHSSSGSAARQSWNILTEKNARDYQARRPQLRGRAGGCEGHSKLSQLLSQKKIILDRAASHQVPGHAHSVSQGHREKAEGLHILIFTKD